MNKNKISPLIIYPKNNGYVNSLNPMIKGTGNPGSRITVFLNNCIYNTQVDESGAWFVNIFNHLKNGDSYSVSAKQMDKDGSTQDTMAFFNVDINNLQQHSILSPANNAFINSPVPIISGNGKPGAVIEMQTNSDVYITNVDANGSWRIIIEKPLAEGLVSSTVYQKDMGNISELPLNFTIDTKAPVAPAILAPDDKGYVNSPNPTIHGEAESKATVNLIIDDKTYATTADESGSWNVKVNDNLLDDEHIISAKQQDRAGNISSESISVFNVDTIAPSAPIILSPENGQFLKTSTPIITGSGEKNCRIELKYNEKIYSTTVEPDGQWSLNINNTLSDGAHLFDVCQIDDAGNYSPNSALTVKIKTISPLTPVIIYPVNGEYVNAANILIKGTGEPDAKIVAKLAGKTFNTNVQTNGSWSIQVDGLLYDGQNYSITAHQIDLAENVSVPAKSKFKVDTKALTKPIITFPLNNSHINTEYPTVTGKGSSNANLQATINNLTYKTAINEQGEWNFIINEKLPQGINQMSVTQVDMGNTSEALEVNFSVDTEAPAMPVINHPLNNSTVNQNNIQFEGLGEIDCTVNILFDDKTYDIEAGKDGTWTMNVENIDNGLHTISVSQSDRAGNFSPRNTICFIVNAQQNNMNSNISDKEPVTGNITYNPAGPDFSTFTIITLTTDKPVTVNNTVGRIFTKPITANGINTFNYIDSYGKQGSIDSGVTWIDETAPYIYIGYTGNYFSSDKTIEYQVSFSGLKSALINGIPFESGTVITQEGYYTVQVCDNAGNLVTKNFVIDKTSPNVEGVENNNVYRSSVNIKYFDNMTGIQSASLDNSPIVSGHVVETVGSHILQLTDFADNTTKINFTIS